MKKILTLLALLCMVCTGAWAEEITVTSVDQLQNGVKVTIKNVSKGQYVNLGNNNVAFSTTATVFTLKGDNTNGFKLYDATNSRYVGGTRGNDEQALTKTDANEAGLFTFASYSSYFSIHCKNPEVNTKDPFDTAYEYWSLRKQTQSLVTWLLGDAAKFEIKIQEPEVSEQEIAALQEKINNVYSNVVAQSTVGYPSYKTNKATIDNAIQYSNNYTTPVSKANYDDAEAALNAVYALTDINLPEDGKAYTFTAVYQDGKKYYLNYATTGVTPVKREDSTLPASAQFVARKLDNGKFVFVSQDGMYLAWKGASAGTNSNKGYTDSWNETENSLTLQRIALNGSDTNNVTIEEFFGKLGVVGKRGNSDVYFLVDANNANSPVFNQDGRVYSRYTTRYSVAFQIEKVDNPNR